MVVGAASAAAGSSPRWRGKRDARGGYGLSTRLIPALAGKTANAACSRRRGRAHPRAGGENWPTTFTYQVCPGSSPRWRGKHVERLAHVLRLGLIPALAGKTAASGGPTNPGGLIPALAGKTGSADLRIVGQQAHPRAGGENEKTESMRAEQTGSSPRWRGKHLPGRHASITQGLIPALAGKTPTTVAGSRRSRAHPRAGGENAEVASRSSAVHGSSPRWRGKLNTRGINQIHEGLIPALAGKTRPRHRHPKKSGAHPRAGGENRSASSPRLIGAGSSPRWRGKLTLDDPGHVMRGLIPALAGKTAPRWSHPARRAAHPRAGGENLTLGMSDSVDKGSSPRWRGKHRTGDRLISTLRLIPALAGKTRERRQVSRGSRAHPRAGGENPGVAYDLAQLFGSSPRWRGKLGKSEPGTVRVGLIPALAGKTAAVVRGPQYPSAHPRAGGENRRPRGVRGRLAGSSPRWRGKLRRARPGPRRGPAHPRAGGENMNDNRASLLLTGSSPRWRGKRP